MFATHSEEIASIAEEAAVRACWAQWAALGSPASPASDVGPAMAIIDPEALVVLSVAIRDTERRLLDLVGWWARVGSRLTSVQRFQSVASRFSGDVGRRALSTFASLAAEGDRRWSRHTGTGTDTARTREKGPDQPMLAERCTMWLRLRAGIGVGAKADALAFLLGTRDARSSTSAISFATGYSAVASRTAASEMVLARFIEETGERPVEYSARREAWRSVLALPSEEREWPRWRYWSELFAYLADAVAWSSMVGATGAPGRHVVASRARDLMEKHGRAFRLAGVSVPRPGDHSGLEAADGLLETTRALSEWMEQRV